MEEEVEYLVRQLEIARSNLGRLGSGAPLAKRRSVEVKYGAIYQQLVRLGARPQIRRKYRPYI